MWSFRPYWRRWILDMHDISRSWWSGAVRCRLRQGFEHHYSNQSLKLREVRANYVRIAGAGVTQRWRVALDTR